MSSALKVFTRGMFTFAEIIIVAGVVSSLAAIALLSSFGLGAFPRMRKRGSDKLSNVFTLHSRYLLVGLGDGDAESAGDVAVLCAGVVAAGLAEPCCSICRLAMTK